MPQDSYSVEMDRGTRKFFLFGTVGAAALYLFLFVIGFLAVVTG